MAILCECPNCRMRLSIKRKICRCGKNIDAAKRSRDVKYWISYRLPNKKQVQQCVGSFEGLNAHSIEDARTADAKIKSLKSENRLLDVKTDSKMTFNELTNWYLEQELVKNLKSYDIIQINLAEFNKEFGRLVIDQIKPSMLKNYQIKLEKQDLAPGTVDHRIGKVKTMINLAFDDDLVSADVYKTFKKIKKKVKRSKNSPDIRDRILTPDEFQALTEHSHGYLKAVIATAYYAGMRKGEILNLTWDKVDLAARVIRLEAEDTKDNEKRTIPIANELYEILVSLPTRLQETDKDNHVFQYKGKPVSDIRTVLRKACKKAGIKYGRFEKAGFIFHDLRHTFNTNLRKAGVQESVIMEITGHSTREMFDRYNSVDIEDTRQAVAQLQGYLGNANVNNLLPKTERKIKNE